MSQHTPLQQSNLGLVPRIQALESDRVFCHPDPFLKWGWSEYLPYSGERSQDILMETFRNSLYVFPTHITLDCSVSLASVAF